MSDFVKRAAELQVDSLPWLGNNEEARKAWLTRSFPTRKTEDWKYTSLRSLEQGDYLSPARAEESELAQLPDSVELPDMGGVQLVFVNGFFNPELSSGLDSLEDSAAELVPFSRANGDQQAAINQSIGALADKEKYLFSSLNEAHLREGVFLRVRKDQKLDQPVHVVWLSTRGQQAFTTNQRMLVILEQGSQAVVAEQFISTTDEQNSFVNGVTELQVGENARLQHFRLHQEQEDAVHIGGVFARLDRSSTLDSFNIALGAKIQRIDFEVQHAGEGAHCKMNGVYLPRRNQHVDYHTCIEHAVPHCTTEEVFRGIVGDSAHAVFNGRIHIHPDAQKTLAELSNKNLLTSDKAQVDTKPELEIYADDVRCAHGATVAQLDKLALHYLLTRGVSREEAQVMLSFGFIYELINDIDNSAVAEYLRPLLARRFARSEELTRHLI